MRSNPPGHGTLVSIGLILIVAAVLCVVTTYADELGDCRMLLTQVDDFLRKQATVT